MIEVNCALCGSNDYAVLTSHRNDKYYKRGAEVRTVICKVCGLAYANPRLDDNESHELYSTTYAGTRTAVYSERELWARDRFLERTVRWIDKQLNISSKPGKVLDIGCAEGSLLKGFQRRGWDVYGIEPTPHWAEVARERLGNNIITGLLEDADLPRYYFDMVTLTQTLEHMPDPMRTLVTVRELLKDDGIVYLDVPNLLKPKHFQMFAAPHLFNFSPNTLSLLLKKSGFEPIAMESSWDLRALARKGSITGDIDFSVEGDDWQKVSRNLKWGYVRLIPRLIRLKLARLVSFTIRHVFGESRGRRIIDSIGDFLHRT